MGASYRWLSRLGKLQVWRQAASKAPLLAKTSLDCIPRGINLSVRRRTLLLTGTRQMSIT